MKYKITCILRRDCIGAIIDPSYAIIYQDKSVIICDSESDAWDITTRLRETFGNAILDLTVEEIDEKKEKDECSI